MFLKSFQFIFLFSFLGLLNSCGKTSEQKILDGIESANILLSTRQCQPAIDLLEGLGRQNKNAYYLKALSSAYACRAGYSTTVFFGSDIEKTATPTPLGGMSTYSTSTVDVDSPLSDDSNFVDLQTAIDILLYAGGISTSVDPTTTERAKYFTANQASDINSQLAYMMLVQLGKFMKYYADASAAGVKGGGSLANNCFTDYSATIAGVQTYITTSGGGTGTTGACTSVASSHTELAIGATDRRKRLCEGVILLNNVLAVLPGVLASAGGGDLGTIATMDDQILALKTALIAYDATFSTTATVLSQDNCETDTNIDEAKLSSYYAVFFESLIK